MGDSEDFDIAPKGGFKTPTHLLQVNPLLC